MTARYRIMCPRSAHPLSFIINQIRISPGINDIRLPVYTSRILHVFPHPSAQTTFPCRRHINRVGLSCPLSETKCKPELYHSCLTIPKLFPNISFYIKKRYRQKCRYRHSIVYFFTGIPSQICKHPLHPDHISGPVRQQSRTHRTHPAYRFSLPLWAVSHSKHHIPRCLSRR